MNRTAIVDGHNLLFRMFYGIPASIKNTKGKEIRGVIGFIGALKKIVTELEPYSLIVIFDSQSSRNSNLKIDKTYKANRKDLCGEDEENNPFSQLPIIDRALDFLGIAHIEAKNNEADDYIASLIYNNYDLEMQYIIVSSDSDFMQLVDSRTFLYVPRGKKSILYTENEVIKKYNIPPEKYVLFKALVGDRSDNIRGVRDIGIVRASKILQSGNIDRYISANPDCLLSAKLSENKELIARNIHLIELNKNIDTSEIVFRKLNDNIKNLRTYEILEKIGEK